MLRVQYSEKNCPLIVFSARLAQVQYSSFTVHPTIPLLTCF